jgi:hypothetical protein
MHESLAPPYRSFANPKPPKGHTTILIFIDPERSFANQKPQKGYTTISNAEIVFKIPLVHCWAMLPQICRIQIKSISKLKCSCGVKKISCAQSKSPKPKYKNKIGKVEVDVEVEVGAEVDVEVKVEADVEVKVKAGVQRQRHSTPSLPRRPGRIDIS